MKKIFSNLPKILLAMMFVLAGVLVLGNTRIKADELDNDGKVVRVSTIKQLNKAINDPDVSTIFFKTMEKSNFTIKANKNAADKRLIINTSNANITNRAVFAEIDIQAVGYYIEKASGNFYVIENPSNIYQFVVAKHKTVSGIALLSNTTFNESYAFYKLRKGAKVEKVVISYYTDIDNPDADIVGVYDESKNEISLDYTDMDGAERSYTFKLDKRGRITKMTSQATFNFDYTFKYNKNGYMVKTSGYDDDDGNFTLTYKYDGYYIQDQKFEGDFRTYEYTYSFEKGAGYTQPYEVTYSYSSAEDGESGYVKNYLYDEKGREKSCITDFLNGMKMESITEIDSNYVVKITYTFYTDDGEQYGDSEIVTYEFNKAGDLINMISTYGDEVNSITYEDDEYGTLINIIYSE